jgi:hypothetical protein
MQRPDPVYVVSVEWMWFAIIGQVLSLVLAIVSLQQFGHAGARSWEDRGYLLFLAAPGIFFGLRWASRLTLAVYRRIR